MVGVRAVFSRRQYGLGDPPSSNESQIDDATAHSLGESDEPTSHTAAEETQRLQTSSPADDYDRTAVRILPGTLSRRKGLGALLAAVACIVFGSKLAVIGALGSPMPVLDQWDGEAARLYAPYLKGVLSFGDLLAPHNEHRIVPTRILQLIHLELAGEWNPRLEMILSAAAHTVLITWLVALLMPLVAPQRRILLGCFVALLFAVPIGYENTLWGFQSQLYITLLFGTAALVALAAARPFSLRWFGGLAAAVLSYFSFATGVATILAATILVSLQLATNRRRRNGREFSAVVVMASAAVVMILMEAPSAAPTSTFWTFVVGLSLLSALAIVGLAPTVWFCKRTLTSRPGISDRAWVAVGIACWVPIQLAMVAYGRGAVIAVRYLDILLLVYPVGLAAVFAFADESDTPQYRRFVKLAPVIWVFTVVAAVGLVGYYGSVRGAIEWKKTVSQQMTSLQTYFATKNIDYLSPKDVHGLAANLAYPNTQRLAEILKDPDVRAILPPEIRPPDADNAAVRNRLWLKGALAGATSNAVRVMLVGGPALLALGAGLLFAAGVRRSTPPATTLG